MTRRSARRVAALALALLTACAEDAAAPATTLDGGPVIVTTTDQVVEPVETTEPVTATQPPVEPVDPAVTLTPVAEFDEPVDLVARPGDAALYVVERAGRVVRFDTATGRSEVVLDIVERVRSGGERGLLGIAFGPDDGAVLYADYTDRDGDTVISRFTTAAGSTFDPASEQALLQIDQPYSNHNGGDIEFGPDGYLYVGTGDGGSGGDPERRASDPDDLLGKLLRLDPATGQVEVFAIGLRNPWRFGFDPPTGDLWIGDVGQNATEEVNRVAPADGQTAGYHLNFGWSAFEGTTRYNADVPESIDGWGPAVMPVVTYQHTEGCSVSGGQVYRGAAVPDLREWYVYGDFCSGTLWGLHLGRGRNLVLAVNVGGISAVRPGPDDEAYVVTLDGPVYRLLPGG